MQSAISPSLSLHTYNIWIYLSICLSKFINIHLSINLSVEGAHLEDASGAVGADAEVLQVVNASLSPEGGAGSEVRGGVGHGRCRYRCGCSD